MAEAKSDKGGKPAKADKPAAKAGKAEGADAKGAASAKGAAKAAKGEAKAAKDEAKAAKGRAAQADAAAGQPKAPPKDYVARLKTIYDKEIVPKLVKEFGYKNALQVPKIDKIVLNMGVGEAVNDTKKVTAAADRPRADRRPEADRHARPQGDLDLQGAREHADRRQGDAAQDAHVRVPRPPGHDRAAARARLPRPRSEVVRRARQLRARRSRSTSCFPEIDYDKAEAMLGIDIVVCTTAKTDAEARALLRAFNFPFRQ